MTQLTLKLVLDFKWFDLIVAGEKQEEYREIKPHWDRLGKKEYTQVAFQRGYTGVWITFDIESITQGLPNSQYCTPEMIGKKHWIIRFKSLPCTLKLKYKNEWYEILWEKPFEDSFLEPDKYNYMVSLSGKMVEELYGNVFDFLMTNNAPSIEYAVKIIEKFLKTYQK